MELSEIKERLNKFDSNKLIDIVKNYKQYGYNDEIRTYALNLLAENGISKLDLQMTGEYENVTYNSANTLYESFKKNSRFAFICYILVFVSKIISPLLNIEPNLLITIIFFAAVILYLIFLIRSFLNQSDFYKLAGDNYGSEGALVYFFLGMPFYMILYFFFQSQMKEKLKSIT